MSAEPLRVLCLNVHGLRDDRRALVQVVREADPDVMIVQEAPRRWRWRTRCAELARSLGLFYAAGGSPSVGNLLLTNLRVRVRDCWCLRYPLTPGRHLRGAAFARCAIGSQEFVLAGSHLSVDPVERLAQATILKNALSGLARPVILGVDVNEGATQPSWRWLAAGLLDVAAVAGAASTLTYPSRAPDRRIDALWCDPVVQVRGYRVVATPEAVAASDHLPIVAELIVA